MKLKTEGRQYRRVFVLAVVVLLVCWLLIIMPVSAITADIYFNSQNSRLLNNPGNLDWYAIRNGVGTNVESSTSCYPRWESYNVTDIYKTEYRCGLTANLTSVPSHAIIQNASITLPYVAKNNGLGKINLSIVNFRPYSLTAYANNDFKNTNFTRYSDDYPYDSFIAGNNTIYLNSVGIAALNKSGLMSFMATSGNTVDNISVTWSNSTTSLLQFSSPTATGIKPFLSLTYLVPPVASFTTSGNGYAPLSVQFTDTSTYSPTSWLWDFDDGTTSTLQNPAHTFTSPGDYNVTLAATNSDGTTYYSKTIQAWSPGQYNFSVIWTSDTQFLSQHAGNIWNATIVNITAKDSEWNTTGWIVTGDLVNSRTTTAQWVNYTAGKTLTAKPFYEVSGNHDTDGGVSWTQWDTYIGADKRNYVSIVNDNIVFAGIGYNSMDGDGYNESVIPDDAMQSIKTDVDNNRTRLLIVGVHQYRKLYSEQYTLVGYQINGNLTRYGTLILSGHENESYINQSRVGITDSRYDIQELTNPLNGKQNYWAVNRLIFEVVSGRIVQVRQQEYETYPSLTALSDDPVTILILDKYVTSQFTPAGPLTIYPPNGQLFNDTSTGSPTSWIWQFNEYAGNNTWITFNTSQNATFFGGVGTYGIRLNASNSVSYSISTQSTTVTVVPPEIPVASFTANVTSGRIPLAVQFTDTSTNTPTSWSWVFTGNGDTAQSILQSPVVVFSNPGVYSVNLTATNANGTTYLLRQDYINVVKYASQSVSCPNSSIIGAFTMLGLALMIVGGIIMLMTFLTSTPLMMNKNSESISIKTKDQSMYFFGGIAIIICGSILLVLGIVILSPIIGVTGC